MHYYRARFYDAKLGRFISEDPIGFAGGDVNLYSYVNYLIFGRPTDGQFNNSPFVKTVPFGQTLSFIEGSWSAVAGTQLKTFRAYEFYLRARSGTRERDTPIQVVTTFDIAKPNLIGFLDANQKVNLSWAAVPNAESQTLQQWSTGLNRWVDQNGVTYDSQTQTYSFVDSVLWARTADYRVVAVRDERQRESDILTAAFYKDQDFGDASCELRRGEPVNLSNGNMYLTQTDYGLPGIGEAIEIKRTYNSLSNTVGYFGLGWSSVLDERLSKPWNDEFELRLELPNGRAVYFSRRQTTDPFTSATRGFYAEIVKNTDGSYLLAFKDGRVHKFDAVGSLLWLKDRNGNQTTINYSQSTGQLTGITDAFGRTLSIETNTNGSIAKIFDSLGSASEPSAEYEYDPGNSSLLKSATYLDGSKFQFFYDTTNGRTLLKTVKDALGNVLETHDY